MVVPKVELLLLIHNDDHYLGLCINNYVYFSTDEGVAGEGVIDDNWNQRRAGFGRWWKQTDCGAGGRRVQLSCLA